MNEPQLNDLMERFQSRFYGKYRGSVTTVDEDTKQIKAKVPAVLDDQETGWCMPCVPYAGDGVGIVFLPEKGSGVWIEFEGGDLSYPIWSGCYWREGEMPDDAAPAVKVIVTKSPHKILLDDDQESITFSDSNENSIALDSEGLHFDRGDGSVLVNDSEVNVNDGALEVSSA